MVAQVHPAEFVVFGGLMAINLGVGLYFALRHTHRHADTEEVFLGGRSLGAIPLSLSVLATMVTAIGIVGFTTHFYVYGLHVVWGSITALVVVPFIAKVVIPVIYNLKVTSVFQYLRMRFGNKVGITACVFYFLLNQVQGAVGIFAAAVAISTSFRVSLVGSTLAIGAAGTVYTALGGLRGVVWTDSMQGILVLICPITIIVKIIYDSFYDPEIRLRPLSDLNIEPYLFEASLDFTNDENVWASLIAVSCSHFYRMGMDQIVVQRYAAARTLQEAQTTAYVGTILLVISYIFLGSVAISLVYWYRDCDPLLAGLITKIEQLIPHYLDKRLAGFPGFSGLFLAGVVSATLSTVSSVINSLAASFYIDILSPFKHLSDRYVDIITKSIAFAFGAIMTAIAIAIPYLGSVIRVFMVVYGSISGPFVGLYLLALAFPWVNAKGAAVSAIFTMALQIWAVAGKLEAGIHPPRMPVTLDYCPQNITTEMILNSTSAPSTPDVHGTKPLFLLYRLSSNWSGFFAMLLTIAVGLGVSILTGENRYTGRNVHLTSDVFLKLWKKMRLLSDFDAEEQPGGNCTGEQLQVFTVTRHITAKRNDTKQSRWENVRNTSHNRFQI